MVESVVIDVDEDPKGQEMNGQDRPRKPQKRKRASLAQVPPKPEDKAAQIEALRVELDGLFRYYKELKEKRVVFDLGLCSSVNAVVVALMEESELPLSKLVEEIHEKAKGSGVTVASVKSSVLFVGQRVMYGVPNAEADVLEDESEACLWCWETRDMKLVPKSMRVTLNFRRTCRKKIHERIVTVSGMMTALQKSETDKNYEHNLEKALEKLVKVHNEAEIRSYMDKLLQKNGVDMAEKEAKREEKLLIKELERNKREAEKEKKRMERELQKEKGQTQEEAEKDQRRREKEEAELKKQLSIQKQASIMERFLKRSKTSPSCKNDQSSAKAITSDSSSKKCGNMPDAVTLSMDSALSSNDVINGDEIRKLHLSSWRHLGHSICSNRKKHWGIRWKPKTKLFKELKLSTSRGLAHDDDLGIDKLVCGWGEQTSDERSLHANADSSLCNVNKCYRGKQLLQFDKSYRPAFYGIWRKKSHVVGPRHPFKKDPDVDYDEDSDEEWEEEDPGESLSDCDKDEEEESLEEGCSRADEEDDSEDGFFVPDGYLSENEGVQVDRMETDVAVEEARSSPNCKQNSKRDEFCSLLRQQKYLNNLTEHALRKNQPLIILNLMHEKAALLMAEDLSGTPKLEQMCLQALSMRVFPDVPPVEISIENIQDEDQEACLSGFKGSSTPISTVNAITESDLPTIVSAIQSSPQGISKVVESLQQKFPAASKSLLRSKVREISDFVDNRWQVKKEILDKLGLSPEKGVGRAKNIAAFFSKRCLPPTGKSINPNETSPQPSLKPGFADQGVSQLHI
ncbi:chromatin assembly factor 1 subunit FAS1 [Alnus glutinosa]|uniref:chromatin assembly factor 1 subunit FAS1 n=1 Tax=Alnus glutinosa TaxID=3517 RepID=UPI002D786CA7|nr:chromatin assembly factor 1 subunit FAS1 [Alnus glutinosa]